MSNQSLTITSVVWALAAMILLAAPQTSMGDNITWDVAGGGVWDTATANWMGDDTLYSDGDDVTFDNTAGGVINLTTNRAPNSIAVSAASGTYTFSGSDITSGTLTKTGGGTLVLNNAYTSTGLIVNDGGTIQWGAANIINDAVTMRRGNYDMNNLDETIRGFNGIVHVTNMGDLTYSLGNDTWAGGTFSGAGSLTFGPSHGSTTFGAIASHTGGTFVQGGTLHLYGFGDNKLPTTGDVTLSPGTFFNLNFHNSTPRTQQIGRLLGSGTVRSSSNLLVNTDFRVGNGGGSGTFDGVYEGAGRLTKEGAGTLTLNGNNTYTGTTDVDDGTLLVNGITGPGQDDYTVGNGATLGGVGTINLAGGNSVTVENGGTLAAGTSFGTLTINGELILNSAAMLQYELSQPGVVGGPLNDLIVVSGDLTLDGSLELLNPGLISPGEYRLINYSGSLNNLGLDLSSLPNNFLLSLAPNQVNLTVVPIPEPSSFLLLGLGCCALARVRRRAVRG